MGLDAVAAHALTSLRAVSTRASRRATLPLCLLPCSSMEGAGEPFPRYFSTAKWVVGNLCISFIWQLRRSNSFLSMISIQSDRRGSKAPAVVGGSPGFGTAWVKGTANFRPIG